MPNTNTRAFYPYDFVSAPRTDLTGLADADQEVAKWAAFIGNESLGDIAESLVGKVWIAVF